jgi:hypothetical protein
MEKIKERIFPFLIALSALSVSASAAFYSVSGLSKLFAGASLEVIIMASSLEIAKLVIASLLYQYWDKLNNTLKVYLTIACTVLILITSMGIYGFLSAAYQETANKDGVVTQQVTALETKKGLYEQNRDNILKEKQSLAELKGTLSKGSTTQYTDKKGNLVVRSNNATIRNIEAANKSDEKLSAKLDVVNDSIFSLENKILEVKTNGDAASELGPLKYLSELTGVEMNRIINWLLLVIIFVFDPLAIALVIAANFAFAQLIRRKETPLEENVEDMRRVVNAYDDLDKETKEWLEADLTNDSDLVWDEYGNPEPTPNENNIYDENPNAHIDLNDDGVIDESELKQAFDQADTNNDGFIDINEAKNANLDVETTKKLNRLNQALESIENLNNNNSYDFQWKKDLMDRELSVIKQALVDTLNKKDDDTITYF